MSIVGRGDCLINPVHDDLEFVYYQLPKSFTYTCRRERTIKKYNRLGQQSIVQGGFLS